MHFSKFYNFQNYFVNKNNTLIVNWDPTWIQDKIFLFEIICTYMFKKWHNYGWDLERHGWECIMRSTICKIVERNGLIRKENIIKKFFILRISFVVWIIKSYSNKITKQKRHNSKNYYQVLRTHMFWIWMGLRRWCWSRTICSLFIGLNTLRTCKGQTSEE